MRRGTVGRVDLDTIFVRLTGSGRFLSVLDPFERSVFFATGSFGRTAEETAGQLAETVKKKAEINKLTEDEWNFLLDSVRQAQGKIVRERLGKRVGPKWVIAHTPLGWIE